MEKLLSELMSKHETNTDSDLSKSEDEEIENELKN